MSDSACCFTGLPLGPLLYYRIPETHYGQNLLIPVGQLTLQVMMTTQLIIPSDLLYRSTSASQSPGTGLCLSLQLHQTDQIHFPAHSKLSDLFLQLKQ